MQNRPSRLTRVVTALVNLVYLLRLDHSGRFVRQRLRSKLDAAGSPRGKALCRILPRDSKQFELAAKLLIFAIKALNTLIRIRDRKKKKSILSEVKLVTASTKEITFTAVATPRVSVVIPVHNNWKMTESCLRSLVLNPSSTPHEIIVVDDASSDETSNRLSKIMGIRVVTLAENVGFLRAVHEGVASCTAPYIALLNNDTIVRHGWLDALVTTLDEDPTVGMVGSMLLYPTGVLQEAGSAIFRDGSGINVGKWDRVSRDVYKNIREVDYCSGASLLLRQSVWIKTGGFDLSYAPAYYEETDLSFATRAAGYRVMFQPKSQIFHFEGGTYGTDESPVKQELMSTNRQRFIAKWSSEMGEQWTAGHDHWSGASWRTKNGRVLVVDAKVPEPDRDSGSVRMYAIIKILVQMGYGVTFLSVAGKVEEPYASQLRDLEVEVIDARVTYGNEIKRLGNVLVAAILSRPNEAKLTLPLLREFAPQAKIFYDTVDLHYVRELRRAEIEDSELVRREAQAFKETELGLVASVDATFVTTEVERIILNEAVPGARIALLSNIHSALVHSGDLSARSGLLFVGNFQHQPNVDAMEYFITEVLPLIHVTHPEVSLQVVGANLPDSVARLAGPKVELLGWVKDLDPLYENTRVVVAPLRYGAGIKGKIGEAAMHGVPFVCTPVAMEGMLLSPETDCLVGDNAASFAKHVLSLYEDDELWLRCSTNAQVALLAQCSPEVARENLTSLFAEVNVPEKIIL